MESIIFYLTTHPLEVISVLTAIVGVIDYLAGNNPDETTEKYIGITRRILHYLKKKVSK